MADVLVNQPTSAPTQKVAAVGAAGIVAVIVPLFVTILAQFGVIVPDTVSSQVVTAVSAIVTLYAFVQAVVQFVAGYLKREKKLV